MQDVVYIGSANIRGLSTADFERMGVEHDGMEFEKGVPVEVSNALADALTTSGLVRREFELANDTNSFPVDPDVPIPPRLVEGSTTALLADPSVDPPIPEQSLADSGDADSSNQGTAKAKPQGKAKASGS